MKHKKTTIAIIIVLLIAIITGITILVSRKQKEEKAKQALQEFVGLINEKNYETMYEKVAIMNKSKEDFIKRNKNIYEGIESQDIRIEIQKIEKQEGDYQISYHQEMLTAAGEVEFDNFVTIQKDNKIKWDSHFIFPQLEDNEKVRISTIKATRGQILDRNDTTLAMDGMVLSVGIVPQKLGENRDDSIRKIAQLTELTEEYIKKQLSSSWVKEDSFVPIKKITQANTTLKEALLQVSGILIQKEEGRVYPLGKEAGHLIGYVQTINAEELVANEAKGYHTHSYIGKAGLEKAYEEILRGIDGTELYITDENGNKIKQIMKQDKKDGKDVKLTIDSDLQTKIYKQMEKDKGLFVAMQPKTGELLALVSTPTFDSNDFVVGISQNQWENLSNDVSKPLYNRFLQKYCPGSTFKPVTGAIRINDRKN